jgi:phytoene dehydrogenase-like protein
MPNDQKPYDAIIVGGGIAGLTTAAYLCKDGYRPLLIEQQDTIGGLIHSFEYKGFVLDGGIRSIESSGVMKPMIRDLGLDVQLKKSPVTLGIQDRVIRLNNIEDLSSYESLLVSLFPQDEYDIKKIVKKIRQILRYMDVLYGIENPMIIDLKSRPSYVIKTLLPWFFKFVPTMFHIEKLSLSVETYLKKYTSNQALIDMIAQHFFKGTPTFFALGYFSIYFDYHYPIGGTGELPKSLQTYITTHGGMIKKETPIKKVFLENKTVQDASGHIYPYQTLIWAADLKSLYQMIDLHAITRPKLKLKINHRIHQLENKTGAESVLTVYALTDLDPSYFRSRSSGHFFYTPETQGLNHIVLPKTEDMASLVEPLKTFLKLNTYEISIPVLRDESLAPPHQTALIISILMNYDIIKHIEEKGFYHAFKAHVEMAMIDVLSSSIYPLLKDHILESFCSTPLSFEKRTGNTDGAIIGWSYTNHPIPVLHHMSHITQSIQTHLPHVYQAGQWSFSPAGVPISIITGKLAADATKRHLKKNK